MRFYKLFLPTLLLCVGCASGPNIFGLSSKEKTSTIDTNPLIPKENLITETDNLGIVLNNNDLTLNQEFKDLNINYHTCLFKLNNGNPLINKFENDTTVVKATHITKVTVRLLVTARAEHIPNI